MYTVYKYFLLAFSDVVLLYTFHSAISECHLQTRAHLNLDAHYPYECDRAPSSYLL
jgi:hypothetical protein